MIRDRQGDSRNALEQVEATRPHAARDPGGDRIGREAEGALQGRRAFDQAGREEDRQPS
jgi:hypothetical protein